MKGNWNLLKLCDQESERKKKRNEFRVFFFFSLLSQLPASRAPSTLLSQNQEDYLLAARNSGFNPYAIASSGPLDHSSLHPSMYSHPFASYRSVRPA